MASEPAAGGAAGAQAGGQGAPQSWTYDGDQGRASDYPPGRPPDGPGRHARAEIERRWILSEHPDPAQALAVRHLVDRYVTGTRLRLRLQVEDGGSARSTCRTTGPSPVRSPPPTVDFEPRATDP